MEQIIKQHLAGIVSIEYSEDRKIYTVVTKNVFTTLERLSDLKEQMGAKDIEVGVVAFSGSLAYSIFME